MKRGKQEALSEEIGRRIEGMDLVSKCLRVASLGIVTNRKVRNSSTHIKWEFQKPPFKIFSESCHYSMGDGQEVRVIYEGEEVLLAYDDSFKRQKYPRRPSIEVRRKGARHHVGFYKPGDWEEEIDRLLEDVPKGEEAQFRASFPVGSA